MMRIDVLTLFPEMFSGVFGSSILKKAAEKDAVILSCRQISVSFQIINIKQLMIIHMVVELEWS